MTVEIPMATLKGQVIRTDKAYQLRFNMAISEDTLAVANGELAVNHGGEALTISLPTMQDDTTIDTVSLVIPSVGGDVTYQVPAGDINTKADTATLASHPDDASKVLINLPTPDNGYQISTVAITATDSSGNPVALNWAYHDGSDRGALVIDKTQTKRRYNNQCKRGATGSLI